MTHLISCSRRTDVPAFYCEWFEHRLREGFVEYRTSYSAKMHRVSLSVEDVLGFIFWTKNPLPFEKTLERLFDDNRCWAMHFTITGLPRGIEPDVPDLDQTVASFKRLAELAGPDALYWRFDPLIISDSLTPERHLEIFRHIAEELTGYTRQVFTSFVSGYQRTRRNLKSFQVDFEAPISLKADLLGRMVEIAKESDMTINACCNPELLPYGAVEGQCISPALLNAAWGSDLRIPIRPTRKYCRCAQAFDIGVTDSCLGGCLYCYSNISPQAARKNFQERYDPAGKSILRNSKKTI